MDNKNALLIVWILTGEIDYWRKLKGNLKIQNWNVFWKIRWFDKDNENVMNRQISTPQNEIEHGKGEQICVDVGKIRGWKWYETLKKWN